MASMRFFFKSTCTSCRDARAVLRERDVAVEEVNYAKGGLDATVVEEIVEAAGSVAKVLNNRHAIAKAEGWADKPPTARAFALAVADEPNLLRRPILIAGKRVIVGFDRDAYEKLE